MYSKVSITFNQGLSLGSFLELDINYPNSQTTNVKVTWAYVRDNPRTIDLGDGTDTSGEIEAINFIRAFNLDYNGSNTFEVSRNLNTVTIQSLIPSVEFSNGSAQTIDGMPLYVGFDYTPYVGSVLSIDAIEFQQSASPETHVIIKVTTSEVAQTITKPFSVSNNTENPFYFDVLRGGGALGGKIKVSCINELGQEISKEVDLPSTLSTENVDININNSPNGATIIFNVSNITGLNLEYSLDGSNWRGSNVFSGMAEGDYIVFIKDQYGHTITKAFTVEEFGVYTPYFKISKSNSLRFVNTHINGSRTNKAIDENRFSYEDNVDRVYKETHYFLTSDSDTTQFKSNYANISANVIKSDGTKEELYIIKRSENIRLKDSRDAIKFDLGNGQTGVYFTTGKKYDFDTGQNISEDYTLNGSLPEWAKAGEYIKLEEAWFKIEDVLTDNDKYAKVLVINQQYTGNDTIVKVGAIYNRENYNIYEFFVNMGMYPNQKIEVEIINEDPNFPSLIHKSEEIEVKNSLENYVEIIYGNDTNTDVNYSTGITHKIRLRTERVDDAPQGKSENHKTDIKTILLTASSNEIKEFHFEPVTRGLFIKLYRALLHRIVFIDKVRYVVSDTPEYEGALEDTNLYELKVKMTKEDEIYNSKSFDKDIVPIGAVIEIPSLLSENGEFIEI